MRISERVMLLAAGAFVATTAAVSAIPLKAPSAAQSVVAQAGAGTAPCVPAAAAPGALPSPPTIDTTQASQKNFTLYVEQGATTTQGIRYCYVTSPGGTTVYREAPTIIVRQGGTFTMTLKNEIPTPSPNPSTGPTAVPTPPQKILQTDGCAWLPFDGPFPTPNPALVPPGYFNHPRAPVQPMPPWMLENDTNFHTHGWHVSPYVDNVYKSMVWAPTPNTCVYTFTVRLSQPPGTYWYHAHLHGLSFQQVGGGLAGALIVIPSAAPAPTLGRNDVLLLVKDAARNQASSAALRGAPMPMGGMPGMAGTTSAALTSHYAAFNRPPRAVRALGAAPAKPVAFNPFNPPPWTSGIAWPTPGPSGTYVPYSYCSTPPPAAKLGDPLSVNGVPIPVIIVGKQSPAVGPSVFQTIGTAVRYRILNAAADSFLNIETVKNDATIVPLNVEARDGVPVNWDPTTDRSDPSKPRYVVDRNVMIPPSGRVDIVVAERGDPLRIISAEGNPGNPSATGTPYCTGYIGSPMPARVILAIKPFTGPAGRRPLSALAAAPQAHALTSAALFVQHAQSRITKRRAVTFTMYPDPVVGPLAWLVTPTGIANVPGPAPSALPYTERPFWLAPSTSPPNARYPYVPWIQVRQGDTEEWSLYNASGEIHAFHIHQLTFVATQSPFEPTNPYQQVFLDTIALPAAMLRDRTTPPPGSTPYLTPSLTKIVIDFTKVDPGVFVFHCHMLFHEDHGMMGVVEVLPRITQTARR